MDYFAVSLPDFLVFEDDLDRRNRIHCHYMMALGYLGLGERGQAETHFAARVGDGCRPRGGCGAPQVGVGARGQT